MALTQVNDRQLDLSEVDQNVKLLGELRLESNLTEFVFSDTSETLPAGLWKFRSVNGTIQMVRNTAVAGDFSSQVVETTFSSAGIELGAGRLKMSGTNIVAVEFNGTKAAANENELYRHTDNRLHFEDNGGTDHTLAYVDDYVAKETPSGLINGVNVTYTLANTPVSGTEHVYLNGVLQDEGGSDDYTISGATITYNTAPETGDKLVVSYTK